MIEIRRLNRSRGRDGFSQARRMSSYLLLVAGFTGLLLTDAVNLVAGLTYLLLVAVSWRFELGLTRAVQVLLSILLLAWFVFELAMFSTLVESTIHLLMATSLLKLFADKTSRDYHLIAAISFTYLLIASTFSISVLFLVAFVAFVFSANLTFILVESGRAYERNPSFDFSLKGYLKAAGVITFLIFLLAIPVFLAFPRSPLGLFKGDDAGANLSGFTDHVNLGDLGRIIVDRRVFMRVRLDDPPIVENLKWKGVALEHYDGDSWHNLKKSYRPVVKNTATRSFEITRTRRRGETNLRQHFSSVVHSNVIFGAGRIIQVFGLPGEIIQSDEQGSLTFFTSRPGDTVNYVVDSGVIPRSQKLARVTSGEVPLAIRERYLQLPELDRRIVAAAERESGRVSDPVSKALTLENYLRSEFGYSLANVSSRTADPLADFLFASREGHCEFFATALAVMLRTIGIPSRVVNGFRAGEYNEWNGYYTVRHSDAHSWVEAYFPGSGWIEFDPTPSAPSESGYYALRAGRQFLDAIDLFWAEVLTFDRFKQVGFFISVASQVRNTTSKLRELGAAIQSGLSEFRLSRLMILSLKQVLLLALTLLIGIALVFGLRRYWVRLKYLVKRLLTKRSETDPATLLYQDLLRSLHRRGLDRRPSETPHEFFSRIASEVEDLPLARMTRVYYRSRFGGHILSDKDIAEFRVVG